MRRLLLLVLLGAVSLDCRPAAERPHAVVLLVGDGFGFSQLALARRAIAGPGGRLALEALPVTGIVSTASASNAVTDSGAAATAFGAGVKTDNKYIALDSDRRPVRTLGEAAKAAGWRVGYVTTTRITHATPACFYAHHDDRYDETEIAAQLVAADVDLALGGGLAQFQPVSVGGLRTDERDLVAEARASGWSVLRRGDPLAWDGRGRLLGLFARSHLAFQLDDRGFPPERRDPSLAAMTRLALEGLSSGGSRFFLMVEGGRIDHAGHSHDAAGVVAEIAAFDDAVRAVLDWQAAHRDTLVVLTADHATGGLAINDFSRWEDLARRTASVAWLSEQVRNAGAGVELLGEKTGYPDLFTGDDLAALRGGPTAYEAQRRLGRRLSERDGFTWVPRVDPDETEGHTGEDVPVLAGGAGAARFGGLLDNTEIARRIAELAGWGLASGP